MAMSAVRWFALIVTVALAAAFAHIYGVLLEREQGLTDLRGVLDEALVALDDTLRKARLMCGRLAVGGEGGAESVAWTCAQGDEGCDLGAEECRRLLEEAGDACPTEDTPAALGIEEPAQQEMGVDVEEPARRPSPPEGAHAEGGTEAPPPPLQQEQAAAGSDAAQEAQQAEQQAAQQGEQHGEQQPEAQQQTQQPEAQQSEAQLPDAEQPAQQAEAQQQAPLPETVAMPLGPGSVEPEARPGAADEASHFAAGPCADAADAAGPQAGDAAPGEGSAAEEEREAAPPPLAVEAEAPARKPTEAPAGDAAAAASQAAGGPGPEAVLADAAPEGGGRAAEAASGAGAEGAEAPGKQQQEAEGAKPREGKEDGPEEHDGSAKPKKGTVELKRRGPNIAMRVVRRVQCISKNIADSLRNRKQRREERLKKFEAAASLADVAGSGSGVAAAAAASLIFAVGTAALLVSRLRLDRRHRPVGGLGSALAREPAVSVQLRAAGWSVSDGA